VLNGNKGKSLATAMINPGEEVHLSAAGTEDPDGDELNYKWFLYREVSGFSGDLGLRNTNAKEVRFTMPELGKGQNLHLILEVKDNGEPSLFSYRRIILSNP